MGFARILEDISNGNFTSFGKDKKVYVEGVKK